MSTADLMAGTFDSGGDMYQLTLRLCFILLGTAFVCGCIYEIIRRKRRAAKVAPKDVPEDEPEGKISFLFLFSIFRLSSCWFHSFCQLSSPYHRLRIHRRATRGVSCRT